MIAYQKGLRLLKEAKEHCRMGKGDKTLGEISLK